MSYGELTAAMTVITVTSESRDKQPALCLPLAEMEPSPGVSLEAHPGPTRSPGYTQPHAT